MIEKLAELIWAKLEPRIKKTVEEAYNKGADDTVRRFAFVYDTIAQTAKADVYAQAGAIEIPETDEEVLP